MDDAQPSSPTIQPEHLSATPVGWAFVGKLKSTDVQPNGVDAATWPLFPTGAVTRTEGSAPSAGQRPWP
jgi:hypothetical protein